MKKIAITQRLTSNKDYYEIREALDVNWGKMLQQIDLLPIILPIELDFKKYFDSFAIDGVLLTGGNDLYNLKQCDSSKKRDNFENGMIEYAILNSIPIFGVCRGMQKIADYFGCDFYKTEIHVATRHDINFNPKSEYASYLKNINKVNSFHNYAIKNLSDVLLVSAYSGDGVIEAIEHKQHRIFGQMWHSERELHFDYDELKLIKNFF